MVECIIYIDFITERKDHEQSQHHFTCTGMYNYTYSYIHYDIYYDKKNIDNALAEMYSVTILDSLA